MLGVVFQSRGKVVDRDLCIEPDFRNLDLNVDKSYLHNMFTSMLDLNLIGANAVRENTTAVEQIVGQYARACACTLEETCHLIALRLSSVIAGGWRKAALGIRRYAT